MTPPPKPARPPRPRKPSRDATPPEGERIAKVLSRAGIASRREAERLIAAGAVSVNGRVIDSPALNVTPADRVAVNGTPVAEAEPPRLWLYYKPEGLVTTAADEKGRPTVFDALPEGMPRVMPVGRLDLNSEGLLLLTNDGALKRRLELPATGWLRRYRVRVNGRPLDPDLEPLRRGIEVEGERFQPMEVTLDRQQGANAWLTVGLREGKNREIRRAMAAIGLTVNRLIRTGYGPFRLGELRPGQVEELRPKVLRDQLGLDVRSPRDPAGAPQPAENPPRSRPRPAAAPGEAAARSGRDSEAGPDRKAPASLIRPRTAPTSARIAEKPAPEGRPPATPPRGEGDAPRTRLRRLRTPATPGEAATRPSRESEAGQDRKAPASPMRPRTAPTSARTAEKPAPVGRPPATPPRGEGDATFRTRLRRLRTHAVEPPSGQDPSAPQAAVKASPDQRPRPPAAQDTARPSGPGPAPRLRKRPGHPPEDGTDPVKTAPPAKSTAKRAAERQPSRPRTDTAEARDPTQTPPDTPRGRRPPRPPRPRGSA